MKIRHCHAVLLLPCLFGLAQAQQRNNAMAIVLDTSAPLADMAQGAPPPTAWQVQALRPILPAMRSSLPARLARSAAPVHPLPQGPATPPMVQVQTDGTQRNMDGPAANGTVPANVSAAIGEVHYVLSQNTRLAIYDKQEGTLLLGPIDGATVFAGLQGSPGGDACRRGHGGPLAVQYDKAAQRWLFSRTAWAPGQAATGPWYACLALSINFDALGGYYRYALNLQGAWTDELAVSVWTDAYYLSMPAFRGPQGAYLGPRVCGLDRATMLAGSDARLHCWNLGTAYGPVRVADFEGTLAPPEGSPAWLLALGTGEQLIAWRASFTADYLGEPVALPVAPYRPACSGPCIVQPAPGEALAGLGDRWPGRIVYRRLATQETLVATHNVQEGLRWYELRTLRGALSVYQQGLVASDGAQRWMGSIGSDRQGNIALGYSVAGPATPPGIRYTGRVRSDPPGRMAGEEVIVNGSGVQTGSFERWSAGSAMAIDPADDCRFWYAQQYITSTGAFTWRTRIASFRFRACE